MEAIMPSSTAQMAMAVALAIVASSALGDQQFRKLFLAMRSK
jgi:hypothetical protein